MPRTIEKLSPAAVRNARPGMHADGGGLYLHVNAAGARSWIFRFMLAGRAREMGLGPLHTVPIRDAREQAMACRRQLLDGVDPIEARAARRNQAQLDAARSLTFKTCAERYIEAHRAGWRNAKHADQWGNTLASYVYPVFGGLSVQAIDVGLVLKSIEPIWNQKPETASRVRGRIESVLDWAGSRGYRTGENPARWRGHLENLLPKKQKVRQVEHHAALPFGEIAGFLAALRQQHGRAARALEFAILTAARTSEVLGATWGEIDLLARTWTIPAARMKAGREHRVPLSDAAVAVLRGQRPADNFHDFAIDGLIFPGAKPGRPLSNMAFLMLLRRMGRDELTGHGFRSTFSDWASERTGFAAEVREMSLAHAISDKVEAAYRRGDLFTKRRQLIEAWAKFCAAPANSSDNVRALRG